jgi:hydrogenase maturation protease
LIHPPSPGNPQTGYGVDEDRVRPVLVLGLGNILLEDEGLGVRALEELERRYELPPEVELLDGGTTGMGLLDQMSRREHLLVLDAVNSDKPPGTLVRMRGDDVPVYFSQRATPHQIGLSDVLATLALSDEQPANTIILGMVPHSLELTLDLSSEIDAKLDALVEAVREELAGLGYVLRVRERSGVTRDG